MDVLLLSTSDGDRTAGIQHSAAGLESAVRCVTKSQDCLSWLLPIAQKKALLPVNTDNRALFLLCFSIVLPETAAREGKKGRRRGGRIIEIFETEGIAGRFGRGPNPGAGAFEGRGGAAAVSILATTPADKIVECGERSTRGRGAQTKKGPSEHGRRGLLRHTIRPFPPASAGIPPRTSAICSGTRSGPMRERQSGPPGRCQSSPRGCPPARLWGSVPPNRVWKRR